MKFYSVFIALILTFSIALGQANFKSFVDEFVSGYKSLNLPPLELSYVNQLSHIGDIMALEKQFEFFNSSKLKLSRFNPDKLSAVQKIDYQLIKYETDLNLQRISLERKWLNNRQSQMSANGIYTIPKGKQWYRYLIKRWVDDDVTPEQIYKFGVNEIVLAQKHVQAIRKQTGLNENAFYRHLTTPSFYITNGDSIQQAFERVKTTVLKNLPKLFNNTHIPDVAIHKADNKALAQTPGYYDENVFYYNTYDNHLNRRQIDWLFLHEAIPGHHYQSNILAQANTSEVQKLFYYMGFAEGWGAYAEEYDKELGLYKTPYDELGKWEWGIVRSVRLPLDVGINYYGWTDAKALAFWRKNIKGQDDIAMREIARVRRWPAQVITYKYGAAKLLVWKQKLIDKQGKAFDIKDFHDRVLSHGSLPFFMVYENVFN